ncbi:nuclear envelope integral membrane protein 2 [Brienomyrus brachyistius]|uniref:nuclear envelope integral membrane protein 2 n=1 Tax=Brienomyrus brachyistius TaxID=42636 RepID=UPI0020B45F45|nr:nuclear envelope integral membrane protein 2 [Brienomyrus brachyistius]
MCRIVCLCLERKGDASEFETKASAALVTMKGPSVLLTPLLSVIIISFGHMCAADDQQYSHADCTYLKENEASPYYGGRCFCYSSGTVIKWNDFCSTFQVHVESAYDVHITFPLEGNGSQGPRVLVTQLRGLLTQYWPWGAQEDLGVGIPLEDKEVCFAVQAKPNVRYSLHLTGKRVNWMHFGLFLSGVFLFLSARTLCRSTLVYYVTNVCLGILFPGSSVLIVLALKGFMRRKVPFLVLLAVSCGFNWLTHRWLLTNWDPARLIYRKEFLGYLLLSCAVSFAVCHRHRHTGMCALGVMTWGLRAVGLGLIYLGVSYPPAAHVTAGVLLGLKLLPPCWVFLLGLCREARKPFASVLGPLRRGQPQVRLLTEEEYREQGERQTRASLEELRQYCNKPGFPAWETVLRLRYPQRFAEFLRSGSHITAEESQNHDHQYGLGGAFFEDMIFRSGSITDPGVRRPSSQLGAGDDVFGDEPGGRESVPPPTPGLPPPGTPYTPMPQVGPLAYNLPLCPYPSTPYIPLSEPMDTEEPF